MPDNARRNPWYMGLFAKDFQPAEVGQNCNPPEIPALDTNFITDCVMPNIDDIPIIQQADPLKDEPPVPPFLPPCAELVFDANATIGYDSEAVVPTASLAMGQDVARNNVVQCNHDVAVNLDIRLPLPDVALVHFTLEEDLVNNSANAHIDSTGTDNGELIRVTTKDNIRGGIGDKGVAWKYVDTASYTFASGELTVVVDSDVSVVVPVDTIFTYGVLTFRVTETITSLPTGSTASVPAERVMVPYDVDFAFTVPVVAVQSGAASNLPVGAVLTTTGITNFVTAIAVDGLTGGAGGEVIDTRYEIINLNNDPAVLVQFELLEDLPPDGDALARIISEGANNGEKILVYSPIGAQGVTGNVGIAWQSFKEEPTLPADTAYRVLTAPVGDTDITFFVLTSPLTGSTASAIIDNPQSLDNGSTITVETFVGHRGERNSRGMAHVLYTSDGLGGWIKSYRVILLEVDPLAGALATLTDTLLPGEEAGAQIRAPYDDGDNKDVLARSYIGHTAGAGYSALLWNDNLTLPQQESYFASITKLDDFSVVRFVLTSDLTASTANATIVSNGPDNGNAIVVESRYGHTGEIGDFGIALIAKTPNPAAAPSGGYWVLALKFDTLQFSDFYLTSSFTNNTASATLASGPDSGDAITVETRVSHTGVSGDYGVAWGVGSISPPTDDFARYSILTLNFVVAGILRFQLTEALGTTPNTAAAKVVSDGPDNDEAIVVTSWAGHTGAINDKGIAWKHFPIAGGAPINYILALNGGSGGGGGGGGGGTGGAELFLGKYKRTITDYNDFGGLSSASQVYMDLEPYDGTATLLNVLVFNPSRQGLFAVDGIGPPSTAVVIKAKSGQYEIVSSDEAPTIIHAGVGEVLNVHACPGGGGTIGPDGLPIGGWGGGSVPRHYDDPAVTIRAVAPTYGGAIVGLDRPLLATQNLNPPIVLLNQLRLPLSLGDQVIAVAFHRIFNYYNIIQVIQSTTPVEYPECPGPP